MSVDKEVPTIDRAGWLTLLTVGFGVALVIMDATIVNVALPVVMGDLALNASDAQWMNAAYALVFAALLLTVGRIGDLRGRRLIFAIGMVLFMAASVVAGLSQGPVTLITARVVQGVGAAMIVPSTLSILNATFTGRARTIAFAVWGSAIGGMAALGPLLGGWLATDVSWRWAFWLNIPVGLLVLLGIATVVPESREETQAAGYDWTGTLLSTLGMGALVFGLVEGSWFGWWRQADGSLSPVPVALAIGPALIAAFVAWELRQARRGRARLLDLRLFALPSLGIGVTAALIVALGEFGLLFTLPLLLQGALGYSALGAGTILVALALGTFAISAALPRLKMSQRCIVRTGLALEAVAVAGLAWVISTSVSHWTLSAWLFLYGIGVGMATAQLTSLILSEVPVAESGQASGLQSSLRQLGSALGVALLGGLLVATLASHTSDNLAAAGVPASEAARVSAAVKESAGVAIAGLQQDPSQAAAADAATRAMVHASKVTAGAASGVLALGLLATLALPRERRPENAEVAPAQAVTSGA